MQLVCVSVNGTPVEVPSGSNIVDLIHHLNLPPERVAVELNKSLVRKRDWQLTALSQGALLEVVEFVGGG